MSPLNRYQLFSQEAKHVSELPRCTAEIQALLELNGDGSFHRLRHLSLKAKGREGWLQCA
jgi:hypothetical protein